MLTLEHIQSQKWTEGQPRDELRLADSIDTIVLDTNRPMDERREALSYFLNAPMAEEDVVHYMNNHVA